MPMQDASRRSKNLGNFTGAETAAAALNRKIIITKTDAYHKNQRL